MYDIDRNFFEKIDTQEKAYILGFIYADGYNSNRQIVLTQLSQDKDILEKIKEVIKSENPIQEYNNSWGKSSAKITFNSVKLCKDISNMGAIKNKSLTLKFPEEIVPENLMQHFIRGYFDGDGCIWNGKRKKMIVKDPKSKSGTRERIIHNVKFTFTGCYSFIKPLQEFLIRKIGLKETKLNFSKAKNKNNNTCDQVCTMEYSGRGNIKKLFDYMYSDSVIHGNRKYNKFLEIFCALEEKSSKDTSLNAGIPEMEISSQVSLIEKGSTTIPEMGVGSSESKCEAPNINDEGEDIVCSAAK